MELKDNHPQAEQTLYPQSDPKQFSFAILPTGSLPKNGSNFSTDLAPSWPHSPKKLLVILAKNPEYVF